MPTKESVWNWALLVRMKPKTWAIDYLYELSDCILCFVILMDWSKIYGTWTLFHHRTEAVWIEVFRENIQVIGH
jgi:hypothetical protein